MECLCWYLTSTECSNVSICSANVTRPWCGKQHPTITRWWGCCWWTTCWLHTGAWRTWNTWNVRKRHWRTWKCLRGEQSPLVPKETSNCLIPFPSAQFKEVDELVEIHFKITTSEFEAAKLPPPPPKQLNVYSAHWYADNPDYLAEREAAISCVNQLDNCHTLWRYFECQVTWIG